MAYTSSLGRDIQICAAQESQKLISHPAWLTGAAAWEPGRGQALLCPLNHFSCHKNKFQVVFHSAKEQGHWVYCSLRKRGSFHQMVQKLFHNWAAGSHWTLMFCFRNWDHLLIKNHGVYPPCCYAWGNQEKKTCLCKFSCSGKFFKIHILKERHIKFYVLKLIPP